VIHLRTAKNGALTNIPSSSPLSNRHINRLRLRLITRNTNTSLRKDYERQ